MPQLQASEQQETELRRLLRLQELSYRRMVSNQADDACDEHLTDKAALRDKSAESHPDKKPK